MQPATPNAAGLSNSRPILTYYQGLMQQERLSHLQYVEASDQKVEFNFGLFLIMAKLESQDKTIALMQSKMQGQSGTIDLLKLQVRF